MNTANNFLTVHDCRRGDCPIFRVGIHSQGATDFTALTTSGEGNILVSIINQKDYKHREDAMEEQARAHLIVSGRVQGVWFRAETQRAATIFGVSGWVRNRRDGTVEAIVEGDKKDVMSLINWCNTGPPLSKVEKVDAVWQNFIGEFVDFDIRY